MKIDENDNKHIIADDGKVFRRKSDKTIWGDEVYLTEVNYNGCDVLDEPIQLTIEDFEEIVKPIIIEDDSDEEVKPIKHNYKRNSDDDDLDI